MIIMDELENVNEIESGDKPDPESQFEKLLVSCSVCGKDFPLGDSSFNEPDKELGHDYHKIGFRCQHCGFEQIAFWTNGKLRKKAASLKALRKRARGVPGLFKQYQKIQTVYQEYFDDVQKKARKRIDAQKHKKIDHIIQEP
jgi:recombinational DNA repair protein (RecF pathway)